jgi:Flp pilus assembly protein TadD
MGRTRIKNKKIKASSSTQETSVQKHESPSPAALLEKAQSLIVQCDYELAKRFVERALQPDLSNPIAREMLGIVELELGNIEEAKQASFVWAYAVL